MPVTLLSSSGTVLLIGAGGIGCASAAYLASSGVGHLIIADFDTVDETNLGRQVLYTPVDVGEQKAEVAAERLRAVNPDIKITAITERLQDAALTIAVESADVVLDGCDNFATRFQVNDACVAAGRRLISGSAIRLEGQLAVFGPEYNSQPCYRCLYTEADESMDSCAGNGVLSLFRRHRIRHDPAAFVRRRSDRVPYSQDPKTRGLPGVRETVINPMQA